MKFATPSLTRRASPLLRRLFSRSWSTATHSLFSSFSSSSPVRVRFAPSPTGSLHIGGLRTALFNYLLSKSNQGSFILRIEDTDQTRLVQNAESELTSMLDWTGIHPDEGPQQGGDAGPYRQSERLDIYRRIATYLIDSKKAYYCFCSERRLELLRRECAKNRTSFRYDGKCRDLSWDEVQSRLKAGENATIRLKLEENDPVFKYGHDDLVLGQVDAHDSFELEGDPIIMKSDHFPTYHMANVIDDHMMGITHVLRGIEWCSSVPKHRALYKALDWPEPKFGHLPLMLNVDGSKLSKRNTSDLTLKKLKDKGYSPEAVVNFVTLTGGGFVQSKSSNMLYDIEELSKMFNPKTISHQSARIKLEQLDELNRISIKTRLDRGHKSYLITELRSEINGKYNNINEELLKEDFLLKVIEMHLDRVYRLKELVEIDYIWSRPNIYYTDCNKILDDRDKTLEILDLLEKFFRNLEEAENVAEELKRFFKKRASLKQVMQLCRLAITGDIQGAPIMELVMLLGKDEVASRIRLLKLELDKKGQSVLTQ